MAKKHRVFGSIVYGSDQWEGQVRAPFFAGYDHPSTVFEYLPRVGESPWASSAVPASPVMAIG